MRKLLIILLLFVGFNSYSQLSLPIGLLKIRNERGGTGETSLKKEAEKWFEQFPEEEKFDFHGNGSIDLLAWLGKSWDVSGNIISLTPTILTINEENPPDVYAFNVTATGAWTAELTGSDINEWISIVSGGSGIGNGTITLSIGNYFGADAELMVISDSGGNWEISTIHNDYPY